MVLGDGVSTTNSKRWSTYWALMKLSVVTVVTITNNRRLREKHQNMHNLWFINRHTNLHKSAYVHIYSTHIGVQLFGYCHFTLFGKCWALAGSSALCLCVFMCLLTYYNNPTNISSKDLLLRPDTRLGSVTDKEHDVAKTPNMSVFHKAFAVSMFNLDRDKVLFVLLTNNIDEPSVSWYLGRHIHAMRAF